jgi:hypothetical protein
MSTVVYESAARSAIAVGLVQRQGPIASVACVVRNRQHAVSRSTLVNGESKKTGAAHG